MREIMSGNEAIARGAWEAGAKLASAYPGTPSTEILENLSRYDGVYSEWSPNEKVAFEVGLGAALAGARTLVAMKHVGVNVAADPLFTSSYTGIKGGLVLITADDPSLHSSQNEQDNRNYAKFAKIPMLEPTDSQECKDFLKLAFDLSERFDTPVMFRTATRISHSKSIVELGEREEPAPLVELEKNAAKYTMLPGYATPKHPKIEQKIKDLKALAEELPLNRIEMGDPSLGIIACGAAYQYAREAFPAASFLKLGMSYPLPEKMIKDFRRRVDKLFVVEELDPFLEEQIRLMGVEVDGGKDVLPICFEFDAGMIAALLSAAGAPGANGELLAPTAMEPVAGLPVRPPTWCPGCGHRGVFLALKRLRVFVSGDIGCYTLGALPPVTAMHTCVCMGAGIGMAHGITKVMEDTDDLKNRVVAVIGDSTFFHSGMTALADVIWNQGNAVTIILDNRATAMTGGQDTPGTGQTLGGDPTDAVDFIKLAQALGVKRVVAADPYDIDKFEQTVREALEAKESAVIVAQAPCVLRYRIRHEPWSIDSSACTGCKRCLQVGCVALGLTEIDGKNVVQIDAAQCSGCGICAQLCNFDAIHDPALAAV